MFSCIGKKDKTKKKKLSKYQIREQWDTVHKKVPCIYKELHSINSELVKITEHKEVFNSNQRKKLVSEEFNVFYEQISNILETINKLENDYDLEKLEFNVKKLWPPNSWPTCEIMLENCNHIDSFLKTYEEKIIRQFEKLAIKVF